MRQRLLCRRAKEAMPRRPGAWSGSSINEDIPMTKRKPSTITNRLRGKDRRARRRHRDAVGRTAQTARGDASRRRSSGLSRISGRGVVLPRLLTFRMNQSLRRRFASASPREVRKIDRIIRTHGRRNLLISLRERPRRGSAKSSEHFTTHVRRMAAHPARHVTWRGRTTPARICDGRGNGDRLAILVALASDGPAGHSVRAPDQPRPVIGLNSSPHRTRDQC